MRFTAKRLLWALAIAILIGAAVFIRWFPCGCLGVEFYAPASASVIEAPAFCTVIEVPEPWRNAQGQSLTPDWTVEQVGEPPYEFQPRSRYRVRSVEAGHLITLVTQGQEAANAFRIAGKKALPVDGTTWMSGRILPVSQRQSKAQGRLLGQNPFDAPVLISSTGAWIVTHSYDGPPIGGPVPGVTADLFVPKERTGYLGFQSLAGGSLGLSPVRYRFCPQWWLPATASWHGADILTMSLSGDGRTVLFCDLSKSRP